MPCVPIACRTAGSRARRRRLPERHTLPRRAWRRALRWRRRCVLHCDFDALPFPVREPRPRRAAARARVDARPAPGAARGRARAGARGARGDRRPQPDQPVGPAPALRPHAAQRMSLGARPLCSCRAPANSSATGGLRDWLRLLSFEVERGRFGCYRPPLATQRWLDRFRAGWKRPGDRWWPVLGAVYFLVAVKRVRGMRLVGLAAQSDAPRARCRGEPAPSPTGCSAVRVVTRELHEGESWPEVE